MEDPRPSLVATLRRYRTRLRTRGPGEVTSQVLGSIAGALRSQGTLRFLTRPAGDSAVAPELVFRLAGPDDAARYARDVGTDSPVTFADRLGPHTRCYLVVDDDRIVHASWTTTASAWIGEIRRYFVVPVGGLYVYESFTHPALRGRGIYPKMLRYVASQAADQGSTELWIGVGEDNVPSVRAVDKGGFAPAFDVAFRRRVGRTRIQSISGPRADEADNIIREGWPISPMVR